MKRAFSQFIRGATRPCAASLCGTLAFFLLLVVACALFITPMRAAAAAGYLSTSANDEYAFLTADALRLAVAQPDYLSVTILGDSSLREAITDPVDLARQLSLRSEEH